MTQSEQITEFKEQLRDALRDATLTLRRAQRRKAVDTEIWFGYIDALRDVTAWANVLKE